MKRIVKILLLSLAFIPLIQDSSVFFPDSAGKIFFTRLILTLTGLIFCVHLVLSKEARKEIGSKIVNFARHPLAISLLIFTLFFIISAVFAVDTYTAFWGDIQRGEGVVGMVFFLAIFLFSLLVFERKDWIWFFKLSLITASILLLKEFSSYFGGLARPGSFVGNPTFLAGYLLYAMFSSVMVFREVQSKYWKYFALLVLFFSVPGILLTETRGAILGLVLGLITVLLYGVLKGSNIFYYKINFKKASIITLCVVVATVIIFFATRSATVWQNIPGFARIATISGEDISTRTRLFGIKSSLEAVNPAQNNIKKLVLGWGPNNYILAFADNYHAEQYRYEVEWFDRAHNKILDVLVANGAVGLIAYFSIWFFFLRAVFRREYSSEKAALTFYAVAFGTHLLFVFDNISTSIPFFIILSFLVYQGSTEAKQGYPNIKNILGLGFVGLIAFFTCFSFLRSDLPAYMDMKTYLAAKKSGEVTLAKVNSAFTPMTVAQTIIRREFLIQSTTGPNISPAVLEAAFNHAREYALKMPQDFRFLASLGGAYTREGNENNNPAFLKEGEETLRRIVQFSPNRPDFNYGLALNLVYQKRFSEAREVLKKIEIASPLLGDTYYYYGMSYWFEGETGYKRALENFEKAFDLKPQLFTERKEEAGSVYTHFIKYFYGKRDKEAFTKSALRLIENNHPQAAALTQMLDLIGKGSWPNIKFN